MFAYFQRLVEQGIWAGVCLGALVLAIYLLIGPLGRILGRTERQAVTTVLFMASAFAGGHLYDFNDTSGQINRLKQHIELANAEREAAEARQIELTEAAVFRLEQVDTLEGLVGGYEFELANGQTDACGSDPVYERRLLDILGTTTRANN